MQVKYSAYGINNDLLLAKPKKKFPKHKFFVRRRVYKFFCLGYNCLCTGETSRNMKKIIYEYKKRF